MDVWAITANTLLSAKICGGKFPLYRVSLNNVCHFTIPRPLFSVIHLRQLVGSISHCFLPFLLTLNGRVFQAYFPHSVCPSNCNCLFLVLCIIELLFQFSLKFPCCLHSLTMHPQHPSVERRRNRQRLPSSFVYLILR